MDILTVITGSDKRIQILSALATSARDSRALSDITGSSIKIINPQLHVLEEAQLVLKAKGSYHLTAYGRGVMLFYQPFLEALENMAPFAEYLNTHDLTSVPLEFQARIMALEGSRLVTIPQESLYTPTPEVLDALERATFIYRLSSNIQPYIPPLLADAVKREARVDIIYTEPVLRNGLPRFKKEYLALKAAKKGSILVYPNPLHLSLIVTNDTLFIRLYYSNLDYDAQHMVVCKTPEAVLLGIELFNHFRAESTPCEGFESMVALP